MQGEVLKLLMHLQDNLDMSYLFITHDLATVKAIADSIVVMQHGRVIQQGPREVVLTAPYPPYTELLLASVPTMDPDWLSRLIASRATT